MDVKNKINLNELNSIIEIYRDMMDEYFNYDFIEYAATKLMRNSKFEPQPIYIKNFSQGQAIGIAMDFFKSLGVDEWYNSARNIILNKDKRIGISIYDYDNIKDEDKDKKDENGIPMYTEDSSMQGKIDKEAENDLKNRTPRAIVRVSKKDRYSDLTGVLSKDKCTTDDIYSIVHEISHTFDFENDAYVLDQRRLYSEITPFCFEKMLGEYLKSNGLVEEKIVKSIEKQRVEDVIYHTKHVYVILNLIKMQEEEGVITKESIDEFARRRNIHNIEFIRSSLMDVMNLDIDLELHIKYLIAGLTASQFIKQYKEDNKKAVSNLQLYCQDVRDGYLGEETLDLVGCPCEAKDIDKAIADLTEGIER